MSLCPAAQATAPSTTTAPVRTALQQSAESTFNVLRRLWALVRRTSYAHTRACSMWCRLSAHVHTTRSVPEYFQLHRSRLAAAATLHKPASDMPVRADLAGCCLL